MATSEEEPHLRLAGVTRLAVSGRSGPVDAFVFDPHRLALPCWAVGLEQRPAAVLLTLDRHFDLAAPANIAPSRHDGVRALDEYARWELDVRNVDHVLAAAEAGLVSDVVAIARSSPRGAVDAASWTDRRGVGHRLHRAESLWALGPEARAALLGARELILDVDVDCFTTLEGDDVERWPREEIRDFLRPGDPLWRELLPRIGVITLAREPFHCGGLIEGASLFHELAVVLFEELLGADLP